MRRRYPILDNILPVCTWHNVCEDGSNNVKMGKPEKGLKILISFLQYFILHFPKL